ncbi:uncharacterized protein B0T23DRAFT_427289 [Neurospora hispaniola]|uniref:Arrestin C-terminal-like domain-containing protein n=1 Tax=Neurospora hispaniola TaxID=588809 RepID=A0AAJ0I999_9PEZI|nr:hypothetical protein B0T23DRAFT_427289 [Neurospora hispaniola]
MYSTGPQQRIRQRRQPYSSSSRGSIYYTPTTGRNGRSASASPTTPSFPSPLIGPRQRRPHSIHIVAYPPGFIPHELRPDPLAEKVRKRKEHKDRKARKKAEKKHNKRRKAEEKARRRRSEQLPPVRLLPPAGEAVHKVIDKVLSVFSIKARKPPKSATLASQATDTAPRTRRSRASSLIGHLRRSKYEPTVRPEPTVDQSAMTAVAPTPASPMVLLPNNRNSVMSACTCKSASSSITEVQKPVASGSGVTCSIVLAEPNVFLTGFDHNDRAREESHGASALLRGKLQLNVSKNVKLKSVTLKLVGKARTEWPEGIPPNKTETYEEQVLRTQSLVFFQAIHGGQWETEYGNQCTYSLKGSGCNHNPRSSLSSNFSNGSFSHLTGKSRHSTSLTAKELKRLSLNSVNSRSFGKGDSPFANQIYAKGYKVFQPGTYEYTFELPIDHHQLETTKLQYGSVKWELEAMVERAGAFKPNLHGTKEVSIVRLPDSMSLEMSEPISISRQWEDQLHYDIMISGKSFPLGAKIPIAFKLTPLAKVQVHKLKVFVTENIEYWTNDRHVTRKDAGRKILLLEKSAGKPLDKQYESSDFRILSGGELSPEQREEARRSAAARRMVQAARTNAPLPPLPNQTENLLGDLDLGLETFWGSTELEMNVQIPTCAMMSRDKNLRLHPDCSWKNVNVFHWIKIVMRISRLDPEDPLGKRRRHFEISIDSPFTVLNCRATQANTALPQYGSDGSMPFERQQTSCGCPDADVVDRSASSPLGQLQLVEQDVLSPSGSRLGLNRLSASVLPSIPQAAHVHDSRESGGLPVNRARGHTLPSPLERQRPMHLIRCPSYNPPAFDADEPPPPLQADLMTPPPQYDAIIGTPSVDGLADYFARLADYEDTGRPQMGDRSGSQESVATVRGIPRPTSRDEGFFDSNEVVTGSDLPANKDYEDDSSGSADEEEGPVRPHRRGRVNVANPRTPGGRLIPSRSLEIDRPVMRLDMGSLNSRRR